MKIPWLKKKVPDNRDEAGAERVAPPGMLAPLGLLTFSPLPLEEQRNDIFTQAYTWPKAQSDRGKWYNNTFWGNRLPDSGVGIGIPGFNDVSIKLWTTQYSPEQTFRKQWSLTGGVYPYGMSVQQSADLIQQQQAAWQAMAGHGV